MAVFQCMNRRSEATGDAEIQDTERTENGYGFDNDLRTHDQRDRLEPIRAFHDDESRFVGPGQLAATNSVTAKHSPIVPGESSHGDNNPNGLRLAAVSKLDRSRHAS